MKYFYLCIILLFLSTYVFSQSCEDKIKEKDDKIQELNNEKDTLKERIDKFMYNDTLQKKELSDANSTIKKQGDSITNLLNNNEKQTAKIDSLQKDTSKFKKDIRLFKQIIISEYDIICLIIDNIIESAFKEEIEKQLKSNTKIKAEKKPLKKAIGMPYEELTDEGAYDFLDYKEFNLYINITLNNVSQNMDSIKEKVLQKIDVIKRTENALFLQDVVYKDIFISELIRKKFNNKKAILKEKFKDINISYTINYQKKRGKWVTLPTYNIDNLSGDIIMNNAKFQEDFKLNIEKQHVREGKYYLKVDIKYNGSIQKSLRFKFKKKLHWQVYNFITNIF